MTCVSSVAFTIGINGERYRYFKSGRGLRQGDPVSPYLFTLIMEVYSLMLARKVKESKKFKFHKGYKEMKLKHLSFADDLLALCLGDVDSISVIKEALIEFSNSSSLKPNMDKSLVFFRSLIASVLATMQTSWASVLLIPKTIVKEIDKIMKKFLWSYGSEENGRSKVAWKIVYCPKKEGGLGLKQLGDWNEVLLSKQIWKIIAKKEGNGINVPMWTDNWSDVGWLKQFVTDKDIHKARLNTKCSIVDMIED
ncbi:RNA-directed DNA polymerase, eukaryota, reverse transcriptase zinc-binding domain protein [Tanacetum coccineum]